MAVLNAVELHYRKMATGYEHVSHLSDAEALLRVLKGRRRGQGGTDAAIRVRNDLAGRLKPKPPIRPVRGPARSARGARN